ncbi:ferric-chelate reductase [Kwoniella mangroviensis CBS 10435]|uniref:Ferric-chelate reductase n=1 Tax=Kwoniella mangroviensis CBS 10435 TaxID=1331196 RepID=A0A1B9IY77_9TREE|nr:ferric-chelate reductase [Kwoniella mangroviensis CBS 10435]
METIATPVDKRFIPIPTQYQIYDSYTIDPQWQIKFTIIWTSVLAFSTLVSIPYLIHMWKIGRLYSGLSINESLDETTSLSRIEKEIPARNASAESKGRTFLSRGYIIFRSISQSITLWTLPMPRLKWWKGQIGDCCRRAYFTLSVSQIFLVSAYMVAVICCFVIGAELDQNSNRPGFIALSQLPVIILLSLKSPLPLPIFLPSLSYEHYNFLHRWAGRTMFISATVHGGMWINQFIRNDEMDQISSDKSKRGILSWTLMCMIVITSLKPVRRKCYQLFWIAHVMFFVGFFAAISYHTPYSRPWIYPCAAIYGYDLFVRMLRYRIKDATLIPVDDTLTMIHIPDCDSGWLPTQHIFVRVLKGSGVFESHPFTITNATSTTDRGIVLYAKTSGDWTRRIHDLARDTGTFEVDMDVDDDKIMEETQGFLEKEQQTMEGNENDIGSGFDHPGRKVQVMIDGPYGGLKIDLGQYENILLIGGGSGITFILGSIEECIRLRRSRNGNGPRPRKVDVIWVVRDMSTIQAISPTLTYLHDQSNNLGIELQYNLYLSNPPNPLPDVPSTLPATTKLSPYRPEISQLLRQSLPIPTSTTDSIQLESHMAQDEIRGGGIGGGLAVIACGPEGIVTESKNAIANLSVKDRVRSGGIEFHGECYSL